MSFCHLYINYRGKVKKKSRKQTYSKSVYIYKTKLRQCVIMEANSIYFGLFPIYLASVASISSLLAQTGQLNKNLMLGQQGNRLEENRGENTNNFEKLTIVRCWMRPVNIGGGIKMRRGMQQGKLNVILLEIENMGPVGSYKSQ